MSREENLITLAERCEAASGPDRKLDGDIAEALALAPADMTRKGAWQPELWTDHRPGLHSKTWLAPKVTASLDSALSLADPRALWAVGSMEDGPFARICWPQPNGGYVGGYHESTAATPALALTAACLRALAASDSTPLAAQCGGGR